MWLLLSEEFLFPKGSIQDNDVLNSSLHVKGMIAENRCILEKILCWKFFFLNKLQTVNGTQFSVRNSLEDWCLL